MISKGFVALFGAPLDKAGVEACVSSWLERFEKLEQVAPQMGHDIATVTVSSPSDIMWENSLQFRVLNGDDFAWIYITMNRSAIETSGLPKEEISLCLDVLLELPNVIEIIDERNDRRLDQLEAEGLL